MGSYELRLATLLRDDAAFRHICYCFAFCVTGFPVGKTKSTALPFPEVPERQRRLFCVLRSRQQKENAPHGQGLSVEAAAATAADAVVVAHVAHVAVAMAAAVVVIVLEKHQDDKQDDDPSEGTTEEAVHIVYPPFFWVLYII